MSDLTRHLAALVRQDPILEDVWVRGEVSNLTRAASGHVYFSLKDAGACVSCVMWRGTAGRIRVRLETGQQLLAHGGVDVYAPRGQYQLVVDDVRADGAGALFLALEQARARLLAEGLLDPDRKRPLPLFPRCVAVITSLSGAAVRDICVTLRRKPQPPQIVLVPAQVQGAGAEESLARALELANSRSGADVIILGRGGGAVEDLWCFNSELLARAIAASRIPVISAVGHETDFTLADLAADERAPTPTAAAERIASLRSELLRRLGAALTRARGTLAARLELDRLRMESLRRHGPLARPEALVAGRRQRLDELEARLARSAASCLLRWRHRLALAAGRLEGLSPLATLSRGYAVVERLPGGERLLRAAEVSPGERVRVRLPDGTFEARVERAAAAYHRFPAAGEGE